MMAYLTIALSLLLAAPAHALPCVDVWDLTIDLGQQWDEQRLLIGRHHAGHRTFMLLSTEDGATWTAIVVVSDGCAHVVASGLDLVPLAPPAHLDPIAA